MSPRRATSNLVAAVPRGSVLTPRHHDPPPGWPAEVFERLTGALAAALVAAVRRAVEEQEALGGEAPEVAGNGTRATRTR